MTIDETINHAIELAEEQEAKVISIGNQLAGSAIKQYRDELLECAEHNRHLAAWLKELKEVKRLLKLSLEQTNPKCKYCIHDLEDEQKGYNPCCTGETANCKWIHADEAEKLLGGSNEHRS